VDKLVKKRFLALALVMMMIAGTIGTATLYGATSAQTTVYGKVTAISGKKITLALGTVSQPSGAPSKPTSSKPTSSKTSSGSKGGLSGGDRKFTLSLKLNGKKQIITITSTGILTKSGGGFGGPGGGAPSGKTANSSMPKSSSKPAKASSSKPSLKPSAPSAKASMSDIKVGGILKVTYTTSNKKLVSVLIMS
jgi:hypothetical protein